jgi:hypothetical protein
LAVLLRSFQRAESTADKLRKELREELEHIRGAGTPDLVAAMAQAETAVADDESDSEGSEGEVK